jgi:hypothetical protein
VSSRPLETGLFPTSLECRDRRQAEPRPELQQQRYEKGGLRQRPLGEELATVEGLEGAGVVGEEGGEAG